MLGKKTPHFESLVHLKSVGYELTQLLRCLSDPFVTALCRHSPCMTLRFTIIRPGIIRYQYLNLGHFIWTKRCRSLENLVYRLPKWI